jgi:G:T-mismatch repair DNA endonuclease (very short patch repair protein)
LREMGWKQIVVWECELKNTDLLKERLISQLTNDEPSTRKT